MSQQDFDPRTKEGADPDVASPGRMTPGVPSKAPEATRRVRITWVTPLLVLLALGGLLWYGRSAAHDGLHAAAEAEADLRATSTARNLQVGRFRLYVADARRPWRCPWMG